MTRWGYLFSPGQVAALAVEARKRDGGRMSEGAPIRPAGWLEQNKEFYARLLAAGAEIRTVSGAGGHWEVFSVTLPAPRSATKPRKPLIHNGRKP